MFSQIEVQKYYQDRLWKETFNKRKQYQPKQHLGESKYREDWYNQKNIIYPKKSFLDKIKLKQELHKFRQNAENLSQLKSSIHGSAKQVNLNVYFDYNSEHSSNFDSRLLLRGSLSNSPNKNNATNNNYYYLKQNLPIGLPPIRQGNGLGQNAQTLQTQENLPILTKNFSQPSILSMQQQQYQNGQRGKHQSTVPSSISNQSLFITKQQQQSDSKLNAESQNHLQSDISSLNYGDNLNDISQFDNYYHQQQLLDKQKETSPSKQLNIPKIAINSINHRKSAGGISQISNEYQQQIIQDSLTLTPTPMGDVSYAKRIENSPFSKYVGGQEDGISQSQISQNNKSNSSQKKIKGLKGKEKQQSQQSTQINFSQMSGVEKFQFLISKLGDTQARFISMVEQDNELQIIFENLIALKLTDLSKLFIKFFRFCLERLVFGDTSKTANKSSFSQQQPQVNDIGKIDPRIFKKISISQGLVKPLENFFAEELEKVEFHKEVAKFRLIWKEMCEKHLIVHNLLLEIGGIRRLKVILSNIADNLQKHYSIKFSTSQLEDIFNFTQAIFQDNQNVTSSLLLKYRQQLLRNRGTLNFQRVTFVDLFIIKHFIFLELSKEEYIPWESKLILLQRLESFRFDNFRDLYNLPEQAEIIRHLKNFIPQTLINQFKFNTKDALDQFFAQLADNLLGSGNALKFIEYLNQSEIPTSYNNIIMMEHLIKSSVSLNKDIPQIIKKIIEHKFITLKRNLQIYTNFNSVITKADEIVNKMHTMNIILLKYLKIPTSEHQKYLDMNLFYQILVEVCSKLDAFSLQDLQYGLMHYNFTQKHYYFWIKSIKRVLLEMKYSMGDVQNLAIHLEKIYNDSTL
ncbi:hypothetical protein ABPG72_009262 [Tetrahymena utriculariae]